MRWHLTWSSSSKAFGSTTAAAGASPSAAASDVPSAAAGAYPSTAAGASSSIGSAFDFLNSSPRSAIVFLLFFTSEISLYLISFKEGYFMSSSTSISSFPTNYEKTCLWNTALFLRALV